MRRMVTGVALVVAAAVLTGCGSDGGKKADGGTDGAGAKASAAQTPSPSATATATGKAPAGKGAGEGATHEVTLEVSGQGRTQIMYNADTSGFEQQTLPWTKTETVRLTGAEQKVGHLVTVIPGSIQGADGMLQQAPCVIKVDGKQVADNNGGKNPKGCSYQLK
ncbi:hypothetical protein AB0953_22375 [Streptomyces sp. NPDC046866]|uniref:hypothetical protein n=1 Tax=Streptomyces sp. NPDC046866 TaxID=3154921 RepID=UPI003456D8F1